MNKRRVAYVSMGFPVPSEAFAGTEVKALRDRGVDVSVHCMRRPPGKAISRLLDVWGLPALPVSYMTLASLFTGLGMILADRRLRQGFRGLLAAGRPWNWLELGKTLLLFPRAAAIVREIEAERVEVLHLFWGHYPSLVALLARQRNPALRVSVFLGAYDLLKAYPGSRLVAAFADPLWTHTEANLGALRELGVDADKVNVNHRGILLDRWPKHVAKTPRLITVAARLVHGKGVREALDVLHRLAADWPDTRLRVLGEGPELASLRQHARDLGVADRVEFPGYLSGSDYVDAMASAQVFLHLSSTASERLPNVLKEAMAAGCICVSSDTPGIGALVEHGVNGFITAGANPVAEATAIVRDCFGGVIDTVPITAAARSRVERNFDAVGSARRLEQAWFGGSAAGEAG